jgi:hypothetical protein
MKMLMLLAVSSMALTKESTNPRVDAEGFAAIVSEIRASRQMILIGEAEFIQMSKEPGTVILDARTKERFNQIHIKGAINLPFTEFTEDTLKAAIPDKAARILIYCNNNFENDPVQFAEKLAPVALNLHTVVDLHAYGYKNVRELAPLLDIHKTKIEFEGPAAPK